MQNGDAEAALVGTGHRRRARVRVVELDPALYDPLVQALGIVAAPADRDQAGAFAPFVLGEEGQAILRERGSTPAGRLPSPIRKTPPASANRRIAEILDDMADLALSGSRSRSRPRRRS